MSRLKALFTALLALLVVCSFSVPAANAFTPLTFAKGGSRYIYVDNPETITSSMVSSAPYGAYTFEQTLDANYSYTTQFYHHNNTGSGNYMRVGVALYNGNSTTARVKIGKKAVVSGSSTLGTASSAEVNYGNSTNLQDIYVPAMSYVFLVDQSVNPGYIVDGKINITPAASNMKIRTFYTKSGYNTTAQSIFSLGAAPSDGDQRTTGYFLYDTRYANANIATQNYFYLSAYQWNQGINEYETAQKYVGNPILWGNYGIVYDIQLQNAAGKTIWIYPNLTGPSQIALWTANTGWFAKPKIEAGTNGVWAQTVPSDQRFKFVLPGGNYGSLKFEVK